MPQPTGSDLHIDTYLSNLGIAYLNDPSEYIADVVFPVVNVNHRSDLYPVYKKGYWFRDEAKKRAPLTESAGGGYELDDPAKYFCDRWGFHKDIPDDDIDNQDDVFDLEDDATAFVIEKLRLRRERDWAAKYFANVWTSTVAGGGVDFTSWDVAGSNPIVDVENWKAAVKILTGIKPNVLVLPDRVHQAVKNNAEITDRFKYTRGGPITAGILASIFEIDRYLVAGALHAPNEEGDANEDTLEFILDETSALLVYAAPRPSRRRPSGGYTFRWNRPRIGGKSGDRLETTIKKWYIKEIEGTRIEGGLHEDQKMVAADCGIFITDIRG